MLELIVENAGRPVWPLPVLPRTMSPSMKIDCGCCACARDARPIIAASTMAEQVTILISVIGRLSA
jgi:hypothetical protein